MTCTIPEPIDFFPIPVKVLVAGQVCEGSLEGYQTVRTKRCRTKHLAVVRFPDGQTCQFPLNTIVD